MKLKKNSWHSSVYLWWYNWAYPSDHPKVDLPSANLCPYVRAVLLWAPLAFLYTNAYFEWGWIAPWLATLYGIPKLIGFVSYNAKTVIFGAEGLLLVVALIIATIEGISKIFKKKSWWKKIKRSEVIQIAGAYARATHDRVCPEITFQ